MNEPSAARPNPYVGPRAFHQGEPLFGRDREAQQLLDLLIAERIVLLHAPSGAGKTSLILAELLHRLKDEGFQPLPLIRVNMSPLLVRPRDKPYNRFVLSMLMCLEEGRPQEQRTPVEELAGMSPRDWFDQHEEELAPEGSPVLIFDQFEELLTLEPHNQEAKTEFLHQVGELLRSPERWALFAIREDYLGALEPYARMLPTRLKSTFRLDLLGEKAARFAIQEPTKLKGVTFTDDAAHKLVDDLRRLRVPQPDGTTQEQLGPYVEPVQLQVVCQEMWERLPPDDTSIDPEDVETVGNADETLARYYAARVGAVAAEMHVPERVLREWFEHRLILQGGIRGQVLKEQRESGGLDNEVIEALVRTHLVRAENWGNRFWFELAHDRLVKPVQRANAAWFEQYLNPLQRQARWWSQQGKSAARLLRDEALEDMERWAQAHPEELNPLEREFLERSQEARAQAQRERRQRRWIALLALTSIGGLILALGGLVYALYLRDEALYAQWQVEEQLEKNTSELIAAASHRNLERDPEQALLLPLTRLEQDDTPHLWDSLLTALQQQPQVLSYQRHGQGPSWAVAFSRDGELLASAGNDGRVVLWDVETGIQLEELLSQESAVNALAFSQNPDQNLLAAALADGSIILWDLGQAGGIQRKPLPKEHEGRVMAIAFSQEGHLVSGGADGVVRRWDTRAGRLLDLRNFGGLIETVAISPDGRFLAAAGSQGNEGLLRVWKGASQTPLPLNLPLNQARIFSLSFSPAPGGPVLAGGTNFGNIFLWNLTGQRAPQWLPAVHDAEVYQVSFNADGSRLASVSKDKTLAVWDVTASRLLHEFPTPLRARPLSVAFHPAGDWLAWSDDTGTLFLWDSQGRIGLLHMSRGNNAQGEPGAMRLALSPDGKVLASTSSRGIHLREPAMLEPLGPPLLERALDFYSTLAFSPDGKLLAVSDGTDILLFDVRQRALLGSPFPPGHQARIRSLAFDPTGTTLASTGEDGKIILWSVKGRERLGAPLEHPNEGGRFYSLAFSPDGRMLAAGDSVGELFLWDLGGEQPQAVSKRVHGEGIYSLAFGPGGRLASGGMDTRIVIWDVSPGSLKNRVTLHDHRDTVMDLLFTPDGGLLISGGDEQIILWDTRSWEPLGLPLRIPKDEINSLAFDSRTQVLFSAGNGVLAAWSLNPEDWKLWACMTAGRTLEPEEWTAAVGREMPDPRVAERACPMAVIEEAHLKAISGHREEAEALYRGVVGLLETKSHYVLHNHACWFGATDGFAEVVMPSCERAVERAPENLKGYVRDTRGVARAQAGDRLHAIEDFDAFLKWADSDPRAKGWPDAEEFFGRRRAWLAALGRGEDPFDEETLKLLQRE